MIMIHHVPKLDQHVRADASDISEGNGKVGCGLCRCVSSVGKLDLKLRGCVYDSIAPI
jgi:hypothetical protein